MKKILYLSIFCFCFAYSYDESLLKEAQKYEDAGDFKNAMILYKKIAIMNKDKEKIQNIEALSTNNQNNEFYSSKKEFFDTNIDKTDDKDTNDNLEQLVTKDFGIYPYKNNYILPASYTFNDIKDRKNFETSFQLSLEKPISHNFFGLNETFSLAYTQKSFWQTAASSAPFRETNYEPEAFFKLPFGNGKYLKLNKLGFIHSSNGKGGVDSRSTNRIYLQSFLQFNNLFVSPRVWYVIPEDEQDNKDFYKYYGYGDLNLLYAYKKHTFELLLRDNLRFDKSNKGAVEFNWSFPLPEFIASKNTYGLFQVFHGYGQSLIDYDREVTNIGIGVTFSR